MRDNQFVFICGLHKSGTSMLFKCLREHPLISGFKDTGVPEDEGQHLQSVYPPAKAFGGPGKFGFDSQARLMEWSPLVSSENSKRLFDDWKCYWDTTKLYLLEKSPPNLIRTRFLQEMFPYSYFIVILRHPVAVSFATQKWSKTTMNSLIKHWLISHKIFLKDYQYLSNVLVMKYENLVKEPEKYLNKTYKFLNINKSNGQEKDIKDVNKKYYERWINRKNHLIMRFYNNFLIKNYETEVKKFGYSLYDLEFLDTHFEDCINHRR